MFDQNTIDCTGQIERTTGAEFSPSDFDEPIAKAFPWCSAMSATEASVEHTQHGEIPEAFEGPKGCIEHVGLVDKPISMIYIRCLLGA